MNHNSIKKAITSLILMIIASLTSFAQQSLWVGQSYTFDVSSSVMGITANVNWSTSGGYLSLSGSGFYRDITVTKYFSGTATVTCEWDYKLTGNGRYTHMKREVTISCKDNQVSISPTSMTMSPGETRYVSYQHQYDNQYTYAADAYFQSTNPSVARVNEHTGEVYAVNPGTAYINVYSKISSVAPYCKVTVEKTSPTTHDFTYTYNGQTLTYTVIDEKSKTCATKEGKCYGNAGNNVSGELVIPSIAKNGDTEYIVNSIGKHAFTVNCNLTSVTIPESVTSIGDYAFDDCSNLTSVTIPNSVTSIGSGVFQDCNSLTSVTIPNSVTSIGESAFSHCNSLTSVTIPNSVTSIGESAFSHCNRLTSVTIPNSVTSIGEYAFSQCDRLTSVTIPNSVTSIGSGAFFKCLNLEEVRISNIEAWCNINFGNSSANPLNHGSNMYIGDKLVSDLVIPNGVKKIKEFSFCGCSSLTSVTIPNSVTSISSEAFHGCGSLTTVTIPSSVTSIGSGAFRGCGLSAVTIPNSVTAIGDYAFYGCGGLTSLTIGNSVISIGNHTFQYCRRLTSVTIPSSVTSIGNYAFYDCTSLTSVTISNSITSIGATAFTSSILNEVHISDIGSWCNIDFGDSYANPLNHGSNMYLGDKLVTELVIPESVTKIKRYTFYGCRSLSTVTIASSVTSIDDYAFDRCSSLTEVNSLNPIPPSIKSSSFSNYDATLYVPVSCKTAYVVDAIWGKFSKIEEKDFSGLEDVMVDDVDAILPTEFYNLGGVKVATSAPGEDPADLVPGIYITRRGAKTGKVIIR